MRGSVALVGGNNDLIDISQVEGEVLAWFGRAGIGIDGVLADTQNLVDIPFGRVDFLVAVLIDELADELELGKREVAAERQRQEGRRVLVIQPIGVEAGAAAGSRDSGGGQDEGRSAREVQSRTDIPGRWISGDAGIHRIVEDHSVGDRALSSDDAHREVGTRAAVEIERGAFDLDPSGCARACASGL